MVWYQSSGINNEKYYFTSREVSKGKKVHVFQLIIPEDKNAQAWEALMEIFPSLPQTYHPTGIQ